MTEGSTAQSRVEVTPLRLPARPSLTVDVEEWYHTCLVPEYVHPESRPDLTRELDWLLPEVLELFADCGVRATFFVLGEVARQVPHRIREVVAAGHEIGSHGDHHIRVGELDVEAFRADITRSRRELEQLIGRAVVGYRSPEWSLRRFDNPKLAVVAEAGYRYDSSLAPYLLAGTPANGRDPYQVRWESELRLVELPPFTYGGRLRIPAAGWTGRLLGGRWIAGRAAAALEAGRPVTFVVHPWELSTRSTPGSLRGAARFVHEAGRSGYRRKFRQILERLPWRPLEELLNAADTAA